MSGGLPEQSATILDGRYRLERVLGEGAFGRVYVAFDTRLQRAVAVKELLSTKTSTDPRLFERYLDRFEREARAAGSVFHPNIVNVFELAIDDHNNYYLIMEYIDGGNLRDLLRQVTTLPVERALRVTLEIAQALEAIHEMDIVHRDLKPANIMLTRRGVTKLTDFGIAQLGTESHRTQVTMAHPGTPLYMSPEQRQNTDYLDGRTDLYSLGLILYEMLAGEPYARRKQPLEVVRPDVPAAVAGIVRQLTEQDPARRYQSAEALVADLAPLIGPQSREAPLVTPSYAGTDATEVDRTARTEGEWRAAGTVPAGTVISPPGTDAGATLPGGAALTAWDGQPLSRGAAPAPRRRWPALLGAVGGAVLVIALIGGWFIIQWGAKPTPAPATATPGAVSGQTEGPSPAVTPPPASATAPPGAAVSPAAGPPPSPTPAPPTSTPTSAPTVVARATTRPDFQTVTNQQYGFSFSYPKSWQRSDDETTKDTLYSVRMSPSAVFIVAKEDNPTFGTLDAYIEDEIRVETTQNAGWKPGPRARQAATLSGQDAKIADFLVPTATGQDYHYYVFTLRPNRAWGLLFTMPLSDSATFQHDIDDVVRSFMFCTGSACPTQQASHPFPSPDSGDLNSPLVLMIGAVPRRRLASGRRAPDDGTS